ncbi:neuralized-like protein 4 [Nephila pilipes]|uniref:Neuralized-like protein 4 n=1 Tax=Nephila pilipes TaxID=299642 RepID=A0A8X6QYE0_NEPPI|nr:neuralized-like protein 4 [Nephila pilipes]
MGMSFHNNTGTMVTLSNSNKTACRNNPHQEFNHGLVMSSEPLRHDQIFEVRIDKKVPTWSGSIEIGVTSLDPSYLDFPSSATNLREGSWVMSGNSILEDGKSYLEDYGHDLDELSEGDTVGVMRALNGELHFFVNGVDQGVSAENVTGTVYAVVDLYGKCAQVTIVDQEDEKPSFIRVADRLHFHEHCGTMVKLSNGNRTAERRKPVDEFNNGVVMTHRALLDDELFEIRIDELVNKWSGSIEMGVTTHNPDTLDFPATMTNMRSGTIMMSGCGILTNGKGSRREYGEYNLDELHEGDRIGLVRKSNKSLCYYINGFDQGIAAENVPDVLYGVVDLYGMTVKVSITDNYKPTLNKPDQENSISSLELRNQPSCQRIGLRCDDLLFHYNCGLFVQVTNGGRTAFRPNCLDDFNNAVVITNRPLKPGEIFEVLLEQIVMKWAGTIEIGVTIHSAEELKFPSTMTVVQTGTWMMTRNGVMYNGTTITEDYGYDLDKLKAGDKIGLIVYEDGSLHFFVNGVDQGLAASNIPDNVYGVIDLYGQAVKASIVGSSESPVFYEDINSSSATNYLEDLQMSQSSSIGERKNSNSQVGKIETEQVNEISRPRGAAVYDPHLLYFDDGDDSLEEYSNDDIVEPPFSFHSITGVNISLDYFGVLATRNQDYDNGLVFSSKLLEREYLYEIHVYTANTVWGGTLRYGVTTYEPESQSDLPSCVLGLTGSDTWLILDSHLYKNNEVIKRNYALYLSHVTAGDCVGVKIFSDNSLHFFINGVDLGVAAINMPKKLRIVADIYGSIESVMIQNGGSSSSVDSRNLDKKSNVNAPIIYSPSTMMSFHENRGRNIHLSNDNLTACRITGYNYGVVISCKALLCEELFQVQLDNLHSEWSGSIQIGVTSQNPEQTSFPSSALFMKENTWIISGDNVFYNGVKIKSKFGPNLNNLKSHHKIGIKINAERNLHLYVNNIDQGVAVEEISQPVYAVVDLNGKCKQVTITLEPYSSDEESEKDDKEKAEVENDGEKLIKPMCSSQLSTMSCDHQRICSIIKTSLGLLDIYFLADSVICFCDMCHKLRGEEPYFRKGDPPRDYAQPFGWCRFPLRSSSKAEKSGITDKWHVAFYGTGFGSVRCILEHGKLLPPAMLGFKVQQKVTDKGDKSKDTDSNHVLISPTMLYAGSTKFSPKEEFIDWETKKLYHAKVAFQVCVRPGSYTVGPQQLGVREPIDVHFSNNDLEWYTKEEGSIILHSLLMKVDPV